MDLTEQDKIDIVNHNIMQAKNILLLAETDSNGRGAYVHDINVTMKRLEYYLDKVLVYDSEEFKRMCELKSHLGYLLFVRMNKL